MKPRAQSTTSTKLNSKRNAKKFDSRTVLLQTLNDGRCELEEDFFDDKSVATRSHASITSTERDRRREYRETKLEEYKQFAVCETF